MSKLEAHLHAFRIGAVDLLRFSACSQTHISQGSFLGFSGAWRSGRAAPRIVRPGV